MEQLNLESTKIITTSNFIEKSLLLLQSSYFFSLLFFSSSLFFLIFHTLEANFSPSFLVSVLEFSFGRSHIFLLCNGILVILVKSSSASTSSSSSLSSQPQESRMVESDSEREQVSELIVAVEQSIQNENHGFWTVGENSSEELQVIEFFDGHNPNEGIYDYEEEKEEEAEEEEEESATEELNRRCEEQSNPDENPRFLIVWESSTEDVEVHDQNEDDYNVVDDNDDEEEEEEGLATEELNKRCEEFIRRMKQGIISESRGDRSLVRFC